MAKRMWFTMKHHGWGWVPITWEGWAVTAGLVGYIIYIAQGIEKGVTPSMEFWAPVVIAVAIFFFIAYKKGPAPKWRWEKK